MTETYAANLIFMWYPVTTWNNQEFGVCFISMQVINSGGFPYNCVTNSSWCCSSQMNLTKELIFDWTVFEVVISVSSPNSCSNFFLVCNFEKLMLYVLLFLARRPLVRGLLHQCQHEKFWTDPVAIFKLLRAFSWSS